MKTPLIALVASAALFSCEKPTDRPLKMKETFKAPGQGDDPKPPAEADPFAAPPDVAAPPADAEKTAAGVSSKVLKKGTGTEHPALYQKVKVHYTGWTTDGKMFDSSVKRGQPATFSLKQVIPGWTIGVQLMVEGEKRRFWIPKELAYDGKVGAPQGTLVFDVELLSIEPGPAKKDPPMDLKAPPEDAQKTESGIAYKFLNKGKGETVAKDDMVKIEYFGWTPDGKLFDRSSAEDQVPGQGGAGMPVDLLIPGWQEALLMMREGDQLLFWVPQELSYQGKGGAPDGTLVFEITLEKVTKLPAAPKDVAGPPPGAKKTKSGVFYKVLKKGTGKEKPKPESMVVVHYTGWTTDGKRFDSSHARGQPATFPLNRVIPGWTEGVQTMVVGQQSRFWIPGQLAYEGRRGPQGMLVFDIELLEIKAAPPAPKMPMQRPQRPQGGGSASPH